MKTVSLELSKQLKEAGYPQESEFYWTNCIIGYKFEDLACSYALLLDELLVVNREKIPESDFFGSDDDELEEKELIQYASPTADEVLDQLPARIGTDEGQVYLEIYPLTSRKGWLVNYLRKNDRLVFTPFSEESLELADSLANMWLYLKKEGLLRDMGERVR